MIRPKNMSNQRYILMTQELRGIKGSKQKLLKNLVEDFGHRKLLEIHILITIYQFRSYYLIIQLILNAYEKMCAISSARMLVSRTIYSSMICEQFARLIFDWMLNDLDRIILQMVTFILINQLLDETLWSYYTIW